MATKKTDDRRAECAAAQPHQAPAHLQRHASLHGTVLIVDDEEHIVSFVARALRRLGLDVITAANGARGVELFAHHMQEIDCVLLDFIMPELGGEEALQHMRFRRPDIPAVIMSGSIEQELRARFGPWRCVSILHKPFGLEALEAQVAAALGRKGCGREKRK